MRALVALLLLLACTTAQAEEGLTTFRLSGGVATVEPDMPALGGVILGSTSYGLTDSWSLSFSAGYVGHRAFDAASFGVGLRLEGSIGDWTHPYLLAEPALILVFDSPDADPIVVDAAGRAALGVDYLLMWGLGATLEITGTLPVGLGALPFPRAAWVAVVGGLYMEF